MKINKNQTQKFVDCLYHDDRDSVYFVGAKTVGGFCESKFRKNEIVNRIDEINANSIYLSVNSFTSRFAKRTADNLRQVNAIFVDVDCHEYEGEDVSKEIAKGIAVIAAAIAAKKLPQPTMIVHSGRGIHLYYVYADSIPARLRNGSRNEKLLKIHANFVNAIYALVKDTVASTKLSVDDACTDTARYARVPGTANPNTNTMCYLINADGPYYTFADFFNIFN